MGEKIDFPLNNQFYFDQALEHLMNEEFEKAIDNFEKVYVSERTFELNRLYAATLFTNGREKEALEVADDQKNSYIESEEMGVFYALLLIKNHLFLEAEVLIQKYLTNSYSPFLTEWEAADKELEKERAAVHFKKEEKRMNCLKDLNQIESFSPLKQSEIIQNASIVALSDLQHVANRIFIHPQIPPTTQKALLELLIEKEDPQIYSFTWLDGLREIVPKELKTFNEVEVMKQLADSLEAKLEKNPSLIESIWLEILNDLLILYPFTDEIITNADFWVDLYLQSFEIIPKHMQVKKQGIDQINEMKKWHNYLNQFAQRN